MENLTKREFQNSLDITNDELEKYIPQLLQGLWELGSVPEYITDLIARNITAKFTNVIDLGCGKGAVLIKLAKHFDIKGVGVDIILDFIKEANRYAIEYSVRDKVYFKTEDLMDTIKSISDQDIVIYGYDSGILGDLTKTLHELSKCIKQDGYILLEFMFTNHPDKEIEGFMTEREMIQTIETEGFKLLDRINWDKETLRETNKSNTTIIKENVEKLSKELPNKKAMFQEYLQNQIDECVELENDYICTTLLLRKYKSSCNSKRNKVEFAQ